MKPQILIAEGTSQFGTKFDELWWYTGLCITNKLGRQVDDLRARLFLRSDTGVELPIDGAPIIIGRATQSGVDRTAKNSVQLEDGESADLALVVWSDPSLMYAAPSNHWPPNKTDPKLTRAVWDCRITLYELNTTYGSATRRSAIREGTAPHFTIHRPRWRRALFG